MPRPAQIIIYFSGLSGSLVHHAAAVLFLALAVGLALLGRRRAPAGQLATAAAVALVAQLVLLVPSALAAMSAAVPAFVLPPLDRAVSFVLIASLIWACAFPRRSRSGEALVVAAGLLAVAGLALSWLALNQQAPLGDGLYNRSTQESAWEAAKMILVAGGLILVIFRRAAGWGAGLAMLAAILAGLVLHFRFPPLGQDYPGAERLADFVALPLFCLVAYWRARAPLASEPQAPPTRESIPMTQPASQASNAGMASTMEETVVARSSAIASARSVAGAPTGSLVADSDQSLQGDGVAMTVELAQVRAEQARVAGELGEAREAAERLRRRSEALVEQEHSRLEEIAALRAELDAARQKIEALGNQDDLRRQEVADLHSALESARRAADRVPELEAQAADARQEAEEQRQRAGSLAAEVAATHTKLAGLEGQIEAMRPQLEMLDRLWVDLQVAQKQAEERAKASPEAPAEVPAQLEALKQQEGLLRRELETAHGELKRVGERVQQQHADLAAARQEARLAKDEAAQVTAKLEKARAKGERMAEEFSALQAEVEQERSEITALAELNRQGAEELDAMQAELESAQRRLEQAAEEQRRLQADLDTARLSESERLGVLQAELEAARQTEARRASELEELRAQLAAGAAERQRLEAEVTNTRARADALPGVQAQLEASRQNAAELRRDLELSRAEVARLAAQSQAQLLQIQLGEKALTEARSALAEAENRLAGKLNEPVRLDGERTNGEAAQPASPKEEPARAIGPEGHSPSGNGGDGQGGHPPLPPAGYAYPADVTLVGGKQAEARAARAPQSAEPEPLPANESQPAQANLPSCPHLGTYVDQDTHFSFPSPDHRCHALKSPLEVDTGHQVAFCLCESYQKCPIFAGEERNPRAPINTQADAEAGRRNRGRLGGWLGGRK